MLGLLEKVSGKPGEPRREAHGPYAEAVLAAKPMAYWRLDEIEGTTALDSTGTIAPRLSRAIVSSSCGQSSPVSPSPARSIDPCILSGRGATQGPVLPVAGVVYPRDVVLEYPGGWHPGPGGPKPLAAGPNPPGTWHHLAMAHDGRGTRLHLDGKQDETALDDRGPLHRAPAMLFLGTQAGDGRDFEGLIDEVALYDRALDAAEINAHLRAAGIEAPPSR